MRKPLGVCREVVAAVSLLVPGSSCLPWDTGRGLGALLTQGRESKAVPGRALHSMPTAGSSQAGPQPGSFLSLSSLRWLQWLHWGMERPIWGQG